MKIATKFLVLLMALILCVSCFIACGDDTDDDSTTTTTPAALNDAVPGLLRDDYKGQNKTCTIWHKSNNFGPGASMYTEEAGVSAVARASTTRINAFEAMTGIKLNFVSSTKNGCSTSTEDIPDLRAMLSESNAAATPDIVMPGGYCSMVIASEGLLSNLATNPEINLDHPTWQKHVNDNLSICGGYYAVSGLFSVENIAYTSAIFFDIDALHALTDASLLQNTTASGFVDEATLYQWAREGSWTWDKLMALAQAFTGASGKQDSNYYGIEFQGTSSYGLYTATGKLYVGPNTASNNIPELKIGQTDSSEVLDWIIDNITSKPYTNAAGGGNGYDAEYPHYFGMTHQVLFRMHYATFMETLSQTSSEDGSEGFNYGVLPMPKMDYVTNFGKPEQANYYGAHNAWYSVLATIPKRAADLNFSGFVLETFTEMGYTNWTNDGTASTIWEAYIEDGLDGRYAGTDENAEMLNLVLESACADFGEFMVWSSNSGLGNIGNSIRDKVLKGDKSWSTYAGTGSTGAKGKVDAEIMAMLQKMGLITLKPSA